MLLWERFTPLDAGKKERTLTTRTVKFRDKYLFANVGAAAVEFRVEVRDQLDEAPFCPRLVPPRCLHGIVRLRSLAGRAMELNLAKAASGHDNFLVYLLSM
jgi:hypothetical protein